MSALFVLIVLIAFGFVLVGLIDAGRWLVQRNEVKSVDQWDKFRTISEENSNEHE